jgi:type II secretory pathway pseudopilin PulG
MRFCPPSRRFESPAHSAERGYVLITLILFVALLAIGLTAMLPVITHQIKRDREEELIHRGTQYSRAIKHYMKKFNRYPTRIEDLENTNEVRFLRKRYKDPITGKDFKLLRQGDVQLSFGSGIAGANSVASLAAGAGASGNGGASTAFGGSGVFGGGNTGSAFGGNSGSAFGGNSGSAFGGNSGSAFGGNSGSAFGGNSGSAFGGNGSAFGGNSGGAFGGSPGQAGNGNPDNGSDVGPNQPQGSPGTPNGQGGFGQPVQGLGGFNSQGAGGNQVFGGGPIVGVASISKDKSIRVFNKKEHYNEWQFIYDPSTDRGGLLNTPNQPALQTGVQGLAGTPGANGTPGTNGTPASGSTFGLGGGQQNGSGGFTLTPPPSQQPPDQAPQP